MFAVAGLFVQSTQSGIASSRHTSSSALAQEHLELLRAKDDLWWAGAMPFSVGPELVVKQGVEFSRSTSTRYRPDLSNDGHIIEATVTVDWLEKGQTRQNRFITYFVVNTGIGALR